jgi:transcriptional regulator with XRE-family HTH domain
VPSLQAVIAAAVRAERERAGLSQEEVARRLGVDRSQVARIESGKRAISLTDELVTLCQALGCTLDDLADRCTPQQREALGLRPTT